VGKLLSLEKAIEKAKNQTSTKRKGPFGLEGKRSATSGKNLSRQAAKK